MQVWTQPIWLVGMFLPFVVIAISEPGRVLAVDALRRRRQRRLRLCIALGAGAGIALSLIAQIGEQVDYLRFMPAKTKENAQRLVDAP